MYEYLDAEGFLYAIRLPTNQILQESIAHLLTRPVRNGAEITLQQLEPGITAVVIMSLEPTTRQFRVVSATEAI